MATITAAPILSAEEIWKMFAETDRRFKETDRKFQETDRKFQETALRFEETDRQFKETDRKICELSKNLGEVGNRLGEFVEHMVEPTVVRLFQAQGMEVHTVHSGVQVKRNGEAIEIDLLAANDSALVVVERKSKLTVDHIDQHVQRMGKFKRMLPAYRHHQAFGAVAAMVIGDSVAQYAQQQGFYVLCQSGDTVEVRNAADFAAKAW